jgi:hypothetical protein
MEAGKRERITFVAVAILLVIRFVGRLMPADEIPSTAVKTLAFVLDLMLVISLVGLAPAVMRSLPETAVRPVWIFLAVVGLGAGIGIFGIRLLGGPRLQLAPRQTTMSNPTPTPGMTDLELKQMQDLYASMKEMEQLSKDMQKVAPPTSWSSPAPAATSSSASDMNTLALQTHLLPAIADYTQARDRLQQTRWVKSPDANSYHPQKITATDLHDAGEKMRPFIASVDKIIADLNASTVAVPAAEKEFWRAKREVTVLFQELTKLLEVHWNEWHVSGIEPRTGEAKPWQKEALRLQAAIDKLKEDKQTSILL